MEDVAADGQPLHQVQDGGHPYLRLGFSFLNVYLPEKKNCEVKSDLILTRHGRFWDRIKIRCLAAE